MQKEVYSILLNIVRMGIGHPPATISGNADWLGIKDLAEQQGLSAVVLDGMEALRTNENLNSNLDLPDKLFLTQWIGEVLQGCEYRYELCKKAIAQLAAFYNAHGFKMMVLKGYACSLNWPNPEHRPCGDIDIWLFGKQKEADALIESLELKVGRIKVDKSHHHHTVFYWHDFMVENHYDFVNVHGHKSSKELEKVFKELGQDDSHAIELYGEKVYLPSANLHALFLIKHMVSHFAAAEISLRQVLDWAFFVEKHTKEIDWVWLNGMIEKFHMKDFVSCINAISVENLGFEASIFRGVQFNPQLKDRVLTDILFPAYGTTEPKGVIKKWAYKYCRWRGNAWKHELCYPESRWDSFWTLLWSHLMKP